MLYQQTFCWAAWDHLSWRVVLLSRSVAKPWWSVAHQAPLFMGLLRQEYWSGFPFPSSENLPDLGIKLRLLHWQADSLPLSHQGSPAWGDLLPKFCHHLLYLGFLKEQTIYSNWLHLLISHLHPSPLCSLVANSTFLLLFTWPSYHQMQLPFLIEIITPPLLRQSGFLLP